jgi:hypothetical protein
MSKEVLRMHNRAKWPFLLIVYLSAALCQAAAPERSATPHVTRQELIGAWRLQSIEILGPKGSRPDPFYNADSSGLIIYDPSGWMSVQILGQPRPAMDAPASRPTPTATARVAPRDAQLKAAVLDTYYAYFGTWEFDEATSTVTHSVKASLIPGETGLSYSQTATLDGGQLIFTVRQETREGAVVRKKIWKRISSSEG